MDIGGWAVQNVHLVNGQLNPNMSSLYRGVISMYSTIKYHLQNEFRRPLKPGSNVKKAAYCGLFAFYGPTLSLMPTNLTYFIINIEILKLKLI